MWVFQLVLRSGLEGGYNYVGSNPDCANPEDRHRVELGLENLCERSYKVEYINCHAIERFHHICNP